MIGRRGFLGGMGAAGLALALGGCGEGEGVAQSGQPFFRRIGRPVGLQLYALLGHGPAKDFAGTLRAVKAMGYGELELPSLHGLQPAELKTHADEAGLTIASLHMPAKAFMPGEGPTFEEDPDQTAERARALGIDQIVIPFPILPDDFALREGEGFPEAISRTFQTVSPDHWRMTAERFNQIGAAMKQRGIRLAYHNHNLEFAPLQDTRPWDILVSETDPELVHFQLDIGWVVTAGEDPLAILRALEGRVISLHVKDVAPDTPPAFYFGTQPAEIGQGIIDWASLLPVAHAMGVEHYFVEREPPFAIPPEEAMRISAEYLNNLVA